ncbi:MULTISPECIES: amidohydrolase family protein [unclassified Nocardioides]|uniref:amidohydrolase family protein n=1 Tax=unclassified Nocardioides TaxID=2615069 RepID=UPI001F1D52F5|nr:MULTISPECIES: amidohydrolase family protein [unclassified Nocardioides]
MVSRIDTHQHIVPPGYREWLLAEGVDAGGMAPPAWSAQAAVASMDELHTEVGIVSLSTPGVHLSGDSARPSPYAREWARRVNDFSAETVKDRPDRFGFFATLTLPDVDGALDELAHALDVLGADGVILPTNIYGRYLGDPAFDALFDELNRRRTTVLVHPSELPAAPVDGIPPFAVDFLLDTTRAALNIAQSGTLERCPEVRMILSHAGGFMPYAAGRMAPFAGAGDPNLGRERLGRFYFDIALSSPTALPSLFALATPDRVLFGSDFPFPPQPVVVGAARSWEQFDVDPDLRHAVDRGNAERLFPRLAAGTATDAAADARAGLDRHHPSDSPIATARTAHA